MSTPRCLRGLWIEPEAGIAHLAIDDGGRSATQTEAFAPFIFTRQPPVGAAVEVTPLAGEGPVRYLATFKDFAAYREALDDRALGTEGLRDLEAQFLLQRGERLFCDLTFAGLRRLVVDIETACSVEGSFSDPTRKEDRILAIGLLPSDTEEPTFLTLEEFTDTAERKLLEQFAEHLQAVDPDVLEAHNGFNFDFDYLHRRGRRLRLPSRWGRFAQPASFRRSRLRVAERWIDYLRCDIPGRTVFDTLLAIQVYDVSARELPAYGLKAVARYLGITTESAKRESIEGHKIQEAYARDRERFLRYLADDLRETRGVANYLLPTYFAQTQNFPLTLQEICLRGTAYKVDTLLLEKYFHARRSLPDYADVSSYEGAFTRSFVSGVFRNVLHFDVASLYPSLLLHIGRNPKNDSLGIFIPLLEELRAYRLKYKRLAREATDPALQLEYDARQTSYKILINSFYGYLGFGGGRFADGELAAEVTRRGRELLQALIAAFEEAGAQVLEADTDGIYLSSESHWGNPDRLLAMVAHVLPEGIVLEFDGRYEAMFAYKAKNYALYDGDDGKIIIRGSALRSRGIEPFLKELTDSLIAWLLGASKADPRERLQALRTEIEAGSAPVELLAKSENLSQHPETYRQAVAGETKKKTPRRAALEVALRMKPRPRLGERVSYYLAPKEKGQTSDWQRARALGEFDPVTAPYDPKAYLKKLIEWEQRYSEFLQAEAS